MNNTKLVEILNSLSKEELRKFYDFLKSPFFNKSDKVIKFYMVLRKIVLAKRNINKLEAYKKVYTKQKYNDQKLRSLSSDLLKLLEEYLFITNYNQPIIKKTTLINVYKGRKCFKNFTRTLIELNYYKRNTKFADHNDYFNFVTINAINNMYEADKLNLKKKEFVIYSLNDLEYLYIYGNIHFQNVYTISKSPNNNDKVTLSKKFLQLIESIEENLAEIKDNHKMIYLEYLIYNMLNDFRNRTYFLQLKTMIEENYDNFSDTLFYHIFYSILSMEVTATNFSQKKIYSKDALKVIKFLEKKKKFESTEVMHGTIFHNSVIIAIRCKDLAFAEYFFNKYSMKVDKNVREDIINIVYTRILVLRKDFDKANSLLINISNRNYQIYMLTRILQSIIYFEKKYFTELEYLIDSTMHYLKRNKVSMDKRYDRYGYFFLYLNKFYKMIDKNKNDKVIQLREKIRSLKFSDKSWLFEKIEEYLNKH